ncbi:MAG: hypothetical protein WEB57_03025 [Pseudohongiellaceae bacterium]
MPYHSVMRRVLWAVAGLMMALPLAGAAQEQIQQYSYLYPQQPMPDEGLPVSPFFEGWYDNGDGTVTFSFGYLNRNKTTVRHIRHGESNLIENSDFQGVQPTVFHPGRQRGVFAVTVPADSRAEDVWWNIIDEETGEVHKVPGRGTVSAYELDWNPRPHGSLPPLLWFESESSADRGPEGVTAPANVTTDVGQPVTLSVKVRDDSPRDPEDERFDDTIPVRVVWSLFDGDPEALSFWRHEAHMNSGDDPRVVQLPEAYGVARVDVTFSRPGTYLFRAQADNFAGPDSSSNDQCCWSNAYQRVVVDE